jgi:hypothetical protein
MTWGRGSNQIPYFDFWCSAREIMHKIAVLEEPPEEVKNHKIHAQE